MTSAALCSSSKLFDEDLLAGPGDFSPMDLPSSWLDEANVRPPVSIDLTTSANSTVQDEWSSLNDANESAYASGADGDEPSNYVPVLMTSPDETTASPSASLTTIFDDDTSQLRAAPRGYLLQGVVLKRAWLLAAASAIAPISAATAYARSRAANSAVDALALAATNGATPSWTSAKMLAARWQLTLAAVLAFVSDLAHGDRTSSHVLSTETTVKYMELMIGSVYGTKVGTLHLAGQLLSSGKEMCVHCLRAGKEVGPVVARLARGFREGLIGRASALSSHADRTGARNGALAGVVVSFLF